MAISIRHPLNRGNGGGSEGTSGGGGGSDSTSGSGRDEGGSESTSGGGDNQRKIYATFILVS